MSSELKQLLSTDEIIYRDLFGEMKIMTNEDKLNKIYDLLIRIIPRSKMSSELKQLLSTDDIIYRDVFGEMKIMTNEDKLNKLRMKIILKI